MLLSAQDNSIIATHGGREVEICRRDPQALERVLRAAGWRPAVARAAAYDSVFPAPATTWRWLARVAGLICEEEATNE
jgi:hypothetical protein